MGVQKRYAVLIGVDGYEDKHAVPALKYCSSDCKLVQRALLRADGFQSGHVLVLADHASRPEDLPRRNNIIAQLRTWSQRAGEDDLFLIAFCGHAREIDGSVYLLPSDARAADLELTALSVTLVKSILQSCRARSKLLFLDACHSGVGRELAVMTPSFAQALRAEGVTVLSACKVNEVAHECDELGHGVFSYYLARGLEGTAGDGGVVTADGLYRYTHEEVVSWAGSRGVNQTPWRLSEGVGDPVLIGRPIIRVRSADADGTLCMPRFHYGSVVPPDFYIDRERELTEAQEIVDAGQSFLLVGDRRGGKTSFCKKLIHQVMSRPENTVLAGYLNLQQCHDLRIETFLRETIDNMLGEIARQVFRCKFTDLLRRNPAEIDPALQSDTVFESFVNIFRLAREMAGPREGGSGRCLEARDFVRLVHDLLAIMRCKGWNSFLLMFDEANRLQGSFPVEVLTVNEEALSEAGVVSVYAASPEMVESFTPLNELFSEQVHVGPFRNFDDELKLLARYYFGDATRTRDLPITEAAAQVLWKLTQGKPFLIQLIAGASFRQARDRGARVVSDTDVLEARQILAGQRPEIHFGTP
jgi:hypothetical protein